MSETRVPLQPNGRSLLETRALNSDGILDLFSRADRLSKLQEQHSVFYEPSRRPVPRTVCCLFFEPSTRTRMSFQLAAQRLGHEVLSMESGSSSLSKGETYSDTVLNLVAMKPDALVIRYGESPELDELLPTLKIPVVSAGGGTVAHPTQALLDAYTLMQLRDRSIRGLKVLIVGDIRHSRVARSNFDVLSKLGAEIAVCGPKLLIPPSSEIPNVKVFSDLDEATGWADVYMGLRMQLERFDDETRGGFKSLEDYHRQFGLNAKRLQILRKDAIIMHPGPINHGVEFSDTVLQDHRNVVLNQVTNGVLIRAAVLEKFFEAVRQ